MSLVLDEWQKEILETKGSIILCSGRQVGKSTIIAYRDGKRACENPKESILIISKTERQAELLFAKVLSFIEENYPHMLKRGKDRPTKHELRLKNGSIIRCLPTGLMGEGIRGFTLTKLTADEAPLIEEGVWSAVIPSLLTQGTDMDLLGTPHGKTGFFYECYKNESKLFNVFHVKSEEVIRNRPISRTWTEFNRESSLKHIEQAKKIMSSLQFAQEYLGEFVEELRQFFPDALIKKTMKLKRRNSIWIERDYYLGIDVARMGEDECVFSIIDRTERDKLQHIEKKKKKKVYLNQVYNKVLELDAQYKFKAIYIDDGGIGVGVFDYLLENPKTRRKIVAINNRARPLDKDEVHKKKLLKEDLYNNLLGLMERGELSLLDDDEIEMSLKSVQFEYITKENALTKLRIFGNYTHIVESLIRACWCTKDKRLRLWVR